MAGEAPHGKISPPALSRIQSSHTIHALAVSRSHQRLISLLSLGESNNYGVHVDIRAYGVDVLVFSFQPTSQRLSLQEIRGENPGLGGSGGRSGCVS